MMIILLVYISFLAKAATLQVTEYQTSFIKALPISKDDFLVSEKMVKKGVVRPLSLVLLPHSYPGARCLDGSKFGYYFGKSRSHENSQKWILFLMGGGACITPIDCMRRKQSHLGSSLFWNSTFTPGKDYPGINAMHDILSSDATVNPDFFDYNHVYLRYCSGDLWTGTRTSFDKFGLWFSGHKNIEATIRHLKNAQNFDRATHVLLLGVSAGGWGVFNNADFFTERWIPRSTVFKAVPVDGFISTGQMIPYPMFRFGINVPVNAFFSKYLTTWFKSALDQSCVKSTVKWKRHRCLDVNYLYNFVDTRLFIMQNRFDRYVLEFLGAPINATDDHTKDRFLAGFGDNTIRNVGFKSLSKRGKYKGDGLFIPSCLKHAGNFCLHRGPVVNGKVIKNLLPNWFLEEDPNAASNFQEIDQCNLVKKTNLPCNEVCQCSDSGNSIVIG